MSALFTKARILKKLEAVYWRALNSGNLHVALRVIELQGNHISMFDKQRLPKVSRIADMTEEQLVDFIARLEEREPDLKDQGGEPAGEDLPDKEPDGEEANPEHANSHRETATEGECRNPDDSANLASATCRAAAEKRDPWIWEPADTPYSGRKNPAGEPVLDNHPHPEWEEPPPFSIWSIS